MHRYLRGEKLKASELVAKVNVMLSQLSDSIRMQLGDPHSTPKHKEVDGRVNHGEKDIQ